MDKFEQSSLQSGHEVHSEDISDIIGTPPSMLVRWGISWVLVVLVAIVALAAYIRYPDLVRAPVRINAENAPKTVVARTPGKLVKILTTEGDTVVEGQSLGWLESTADHGQVLELLERLVRLRDSLLRQSSAIYTVMDTPTGLQLGELQGGYQSFYQSYLSYRAAVGDGIYLKQREYLLRDLQNIEQQREQLNRQRKLQQSGYDLAETEFDRYRQLADKKVISPAEYQREQATLLAKQLPLEQTEAALLANGASRIAKFRELTDLDNQIMEEKSKFMQALNSLISEARQWKMQYVLTAPQKGLVVYAGVIQPGQHIDVGQEIFNINSGSTDFFGELNVPQFNMGKVKVGQEVLVKLDSYPFEEYGVLRGRVRQLSRIPYRDSLFLSRVDLGEAKNHPKIQLATGMVGTAEIITEDASLLQRLARNMRLLMDSQN